MGNLHVCIPLCHQSIPERFRLFAFAVHQKHFLQPIGRGVVHVINQFIPISVPTERIRRVHLAANRERFAEDLHFAISVHDASRQRLLYRVAYEEDYRLGVHYVVPKMIEDSPPSTIPDAEIIMCG